MQITKSKPTDSFRSGPFRPLWVALMLNTFLVCSVYGSVKIFPEPNGEVGMMSSESKYFQCTDNNKNRNRGDKLVWLDPNGQEIVNDPNNKVFTVSKRDNLKLELNKPDKSASGAYKCSSRNSVGKETSSAFFKLNVYTPTVIQGNTVYSKNEGSTVEMVCSTVADRDTKVDMAWLHGSDDLSLDPRKYRISTNQDRSNNPEEVRYVSKLEIVNVSKEHEGKYKCAVDTTNRFLSDSQELDVQLRVHYKPRFDEKTPKYIWVSEGTVAEGGEQVVNISCIVSADPVAKITWFHHNSKPVAHKGKMNNVNTYITDVENMSTLSLKFKNIEDLKRRIEYNQWRYTCSASNQLGSVMNTFEIKAGRKPHSPQILSIDYKEGLVELKLNETNVEPPVDIFRLEIADEQVHLFNKSANAKENANNTYVVELNLPKGEHKVNIFAHNPVGWSEDNHGSYFLTVINGSSHGSMVNWTLTLVAIVMCSWFKLN